MQKMIADTPPNMYSLHNYESPLVKMQLRSCHSSVQNIPALYHLTLSKQSSSFAFPATPLLAPASSSLHMLGMLPPQGLC